MGEPGSVDEPFSFRRIKKKPKALRPQAKEEQKKEPSRGDDEDEETEISSRLADIHEAQISRKRRNGMTALECAVGKKLASEFEELDDDPFRMRGGKMMELTNDKKLALEAADIEHGIKEQFKKETMLRDEHEEMKKYIDQRLNRGTIDESFDVSTSNKSKPITIEDMILMKAAEKLRGYKSQANEELMSNQMLVGIPEVDLGIDIRIKNVVETERRKNEMISGKKGGLPK